MGSTASCSVRPNCDYSNTESMCLTLDRAGVPDDPRWRAFILYARNVNDHTYLSREQRARMQSMVLRVIKEKDFSEDKFIRVMEENHQILNRPYAQQLQSVVEESKNLLREFRVILNNRKGDISHLGSTAISAIEQGTSEPKELITSLRNAFKAVIDTIQQDAERLESLSRTDALTGLNNRRAFDEGLHMAVAAAVDSKRPLSLLMIDIDHFKKFNDTFGHRVGDQALASAAKNIRDYAATFQQDNELDILPARYGGEEFAVVLPNLESPYAMAFAEGLRRCIEQYHFIIRDSKGSIVRSDVRLTVSVGVGCLNPGWEGDLAASLIDAADAGLYAAKTEGRNRVALG